MRRRILSVAAPAGMAALLAVGGSFLIGNPPARAASPPARVVSLPAGVTPSTTIAPLGKSLPVSPATLPLTTRQTSAHVNPVFAILSGAGFAIGLLMVAARMFVTRRGGADRRPYPIDPTGEGPGLASDQIPASRSS